ncbi:hypothetical protein [Ciceribacter ferrooxidans]|uniref:Uncharacterized protein n=1 Tax=Ciceribacter ferrooxidans TaxID=2509717 RepID=A0A4Q2T0I6_9HYPH|nr:hypothetical protein [Ciceribacter ferrooxidans]RYC10188.1 hypothetical protein EUU22_19170 [Ciceribacter ferrooxidans]
MSAVIALILNALTGGLLKAWQAKLSADSDEKRAIADAAIADIKAQSEAKRNQADVIKTGMGYPVFWIAWAIAAIPTAAWHGWGMLDSLVYAGTVLPDVATLPPQLKEYADKVWDSIFYSGAAVGSAHLIASAIRGRR